jgi:phage terminase large subunit-like protein
MNLAQLGLGENYEGIADFSLQDIEAELQRRCVLDFTERTFAKYRAEWFHVALAAKLDEFLAKPGAAFLMVFMPPQHGKSELVSRRFPALVLGRYPAMNIILGSYNATYAKKFTRAILRTIESDAYRLLFPGTGIDGVGCTHGTFVREASNFEVHDGAAKPEKLGSFMSVGVGSGATGNPCDLLILDDVIKDRSEADSPAYRNKIWEWFTDALETRLHDNSKVLITFTRWHEDDLAGRILERDGRIEDGGKWEVFSLPAIKEDESNPADTREIGDALWPSKHGIVKLTKIKDTQPRTFTSMYQQRPAPKEGELIKRDWFEILTPSQAVTLIAGRELVKHFCVDTAFTTKAQNDPCACITFAVIDNLVLVFDFWKERMQAPDLLTKLAAHYGRHAISKSKLFIEPKANGISIVQLLKRMRDSQNRLINIFEDFAPDVDKVTRVNGINDILATKRVMLVAGHWNNVFLTDLSLFPNGKDKEAADVLVMAVDKLENPNKLVTTFSLKTSLPSQQ